MLIGILTDAREASKVALTKPDLCTLVSGLGFLFHETLNRRWRLWKTTKVQRSKVRRPSFTQKASARSAWPTPIASGARGLWQEPVQSLQPPVPELQGPAGAAGQFALQKSRARWRPCHPTSRRQARSHRQADCMQSCRSHRCLTSVSHYESL